jgi:hypothetical protein
VEVGTVPAGDSAAGPQVTDQREFDLTFAFDREQFVEQDLHYRDSVGPYAVYEITGAVPRLVGPEVRYPEGGTAAMLCAAQGYFAPGGQGLPVGISLYDGHDDTSFIDTSVRSQEFESCAPPSDDFGEKIPNDDPDPGDNPDEPENPDDPMIPKSAKLVVFIDGPQIGSIVLLRRVALGIEPVGHNGSHVIPPICCDPSFCGLGDETEPPQ